MGAWAFFGGVIMGAYDNRFAIRCRFSWFKHDFYVADGDAIGCVEFDLRRQAPGSSSTVPFAKAGQGEVRCSIHPKMKLIVTVTE